MLTLKVITTDLDGQATVHLFYGDAISHREFVSQDHTIHSQIEKNSPQVKIVGRVIETSSTQTFAYSDVSIYAEDKAIKNCIVILPKAICYIMADGKTVDDFSCEFYAEENVDSGMGSAYKDRKKPKDLSAFTYKQ